jgi:formamidopyrimidine-DNA glycosylase
MFELPEVVQLARQLGETFAGQRIRRVDVAPDRPKFLFLSPEPPTFEDALAGRQVVSAHPRGRWIFCDLDDGRVLLFGEFGGRLLAHAPGAEAPPKRHWTATFDDGSRLTLAIQMWGFLGVLTHDEIARHPYAGTCGPSPLDSDFTEAELCRRLDRHAAALNKPIKAFLIHSPNVAGIGNGYLQDILFRSRLSPKRRVSTLSAGDRHTLFLSMRETLAEAVRLGGRDSERDLFDRPGGYVPILDQRAVGRPCPECGTPIQKIQYLGGSSYHCPKCQT